jgi:hypothetical protein
MTIRKVLPGPTPPPPNPCRPAEAVWVPLDSDGTRLSLIDLAGWPRPAASTARSSRSPGKASPRSSPTWSRLAPYAGLASSTPAPTSHLSSPRPSAGPRSARRPIGEKQSGAQATPLLDERRPLLRSVRPAPVHPALQGPLHEFLLSRPEERPQGACGERYVAADDLEAQVAQLHASIPLPASWAERLREEGLQR